MYAMENFINGIKRTAKIAGIVFIALTVVTNIPIVSDVFETFVDEDHYRFSNGDGTWTAIDNMFKNDRWPFERKVSYPPLFARYPGADSTMYRLFTKNPLTFGRYGKYFFDQRYTLPYKNWDEIKAKRRFKGIDNSTFQSF